MIRTSLIIKKNIAIICLLLINFLFAYKYLVRFTDFAWVISVVLSFLSGLLLYNKIHIQWSDKISNYLFYAIGLAFLIASSIVFINIDIHNINVDRWSVISSFWEAAFNGEYPYFASSHMGNNPGPMPFYFLLALPFYLINELGYFSLLGLVILVYLMRKMNTSINYKLVMLIFMITSAFYLWEVVTRSNIFTTSVLILWFLFSFIYRKKDSVLFFYLSAILAGFLLSTRAVFIIPYIIFFMYGFLKKEISLARLLIYAMIAFVVFISTFLPFMIFFPDKFFEMNPLIIQSSFFVPSYFTVLFILMAFVFSFYSKNITDLFFFTGLALFITILIYFIYSLGTFGIGEFYIGKEVDISYFIFCTPFFIMYLLFINTKQLKKVFN